MQKMVVQQGQAANQPAARQRKGSAVESPQGEQIAQLEAMAERGPQADKLAQLAAMADASPALATQRRFAHMVHNSPAMAAQGKTIEGIHGSPHITAQRQEADEPLQAQTAQRAETPAKPNHTGLPDNLKSGIESLSGLSMDNVKVHYNSSQPAQLNALAYAQGTDIHVAPGQEQHLPHEAWHVVQQAQGRVKPTMQMKGGMSINDDASLENDADLMGQKAMNAGGDAALKRTLSPIRDLNSIQAVFQCEKGDIDGDGKLTGRHDSYIAGGGYVSSSLSAYPSEAKFISGTITDPSSKNVEPVGVEMEATIGPDHPRGSAPNQDVARNYINWTKTKWPNVTFIRGHLLNDNLGGPGKSANLYPITASANHLHESHIESDVKTHVNTNKGVAKYSVKVTHQDPDNGSAKFRCRYSILGTDKSSGQAGFFHKKAVTIKSNPTGSSVDENQTFNTGDMDAAITDVASNVPAPEVRKDHADYDMLPDDVATKFLYLCELLKNSQTPKETVYSTVQNLVIAMEVGVSNFPVASSVANVLLRYFIDDSYSFKPEDMNSPPLGYGGAEGTNNKRSWNGAMKKLSDNKSVLEDKIKEFETMALPVQNDKKRKDSSTTNKNQKPTKIKKK